MQSQRRLHDKGALDASCLHHLSALHRKLKKPPRQPTPSSPPSDPHRSAAAHHSVGLVGGSPQLGDGDA